MVVLQARPVTDDWTQHETTYTTDYARWNGFVMRNPVLRAIIDIRAASICSSWKTHGDNAETMAKNLDGWKGRGNETFKLIMANLYKVSYTCGDAYAEIIWDGKMPVDMEILPSDNVRQVVKRGKIIRYEEVTGGAKWRTNEIFHLAYGQRGAMSHGIGIVEPMQNILVDYEQMIQQGSEIFRLFTKPMQIIQANTDRKEKLDDIRDQLKDSEQTFSRTIVLPKALIDKVETVSLSVPLQPGQWVKELQDKIFIATHTPELMLGTGNSTSEEDARTRIAGFRGSVRFDQKWLEELLRKQIFEQAYPDGTPDIQFSFATEAQDERFQRNIEAATAIQGWQISLENKTALLADLMEEAGVLED